MGEIRESSLSPRLLFVFRAWVSLMNFLAFGFLTWNVRMLVSQISRLLLGLRIPSPVGLLLPFRPMLEVESSGTQGMIYIE